MKRILLLFALAFSSIINAQSKTEKIKTLLVLTKFADLGVTMANSYFDQFKTMYPDVPAEFWEKAKQEFRAEDLLNYIIPIYEKHFAESEIDDLIKFYNSATGKKLTEKMPLIFKDSQEAGREWGINLGKKVVKELGEKYDFTEPPQVISQ